MNKIIGPETVLAAFVRYPLVLPDGRTMYQIEVEGGRYSGNEMPSVRDASGQPIELHEEIAAGSIVMMALRNDWELCAVKLLSPWWDDPFVEKAV